MRAEQVAHHLRHRAVARPNDQMDVIRHPGVCVDLDVVLRQHGGQSFFEEQPIRLDAEDVLTVRSPGTEVQEL